MNFVVRVVKRRDREAADKSDSASVPSEDRRSRTEMIVKSWITASRERRRVETADHLSQVKAWQKHPGLEALSASIATPTTN